MSKVNYKKELPVYRDIDILVVGAGPAGIGAAVCAARNSAKTMVIDDSGCVGGQATNGLVGPFMTVYDAKSEKQIIKGIFQEIVDRMVEMGGAIQPSEVRSETSRAGFYKIGHDHVGPFDHEALKMVASDMILEAGAELLLHTRFIDVLKEEDRIVGVVIANKSGMSVIRAKIIIDCSGDADVAARSGVRYELGNINDGNMQPATMFFRVCNVDSERLKAHIKEHEAEIRPFYGPFSWLIRDKQEEWGNVPRAEVCLFESPEPGEYRLNVTRILDIDGTNAEDLTKAELIGMKQVHKVFDFMKKYAVGFENAKFMGTAARVGIRETRHIEGLYKLTSDDVINCRVPENSIAVLATNMDTHNKNDPGGTYYTLEKGPYFGVPYTCLVPKAVSNLLVAGRSISADAIAGSATRMIPCCIVFGQAAGTAAALAVKEGKLPAAVDVKKLRVTLKEQGAFLGD
ncbi:putative thiazole biosynthetic enzyme [Ruminiclostridium hungatei]|uniref:Putative thiazole biosynthetic enzyme n=1 Tax=Ruminiclostridium hungatei TaxID=48256 RepID=A0A1V4SNR2_RUMHU|nr:FAD-dependent oxidoreductase [Ruminiclostridium hungatei]OPX45105.1 putative thiazole biosynthetic enzyme [Ruminiclostridium hungatei]